MQCLSLKVYVRDAKQKKMRLDNLVLALMMLKNASVRNAQCERDVAEGICKGSFHACSKDQTKIISFLSEQDCRKRVGW